MSIDHDACRRPPPGSGLIIIVIISIMISCSSSSSSSSSSTVSFHNFKSRNFKLSVPNPKNKYVAYVSVLSQISNCQGLGRKSKREILKTDRHNGNNNNNK